MKSIKIIVAPVLMSLILSSCVFNNCKQEKITTSELKWFESLAAEEVILFYSNESNVDTFVMSSNDQYFTSCNKFELGVFQFEKKVITFKIKNPRKSIMGRDYFQIEFIAQPDNKDCKKYFRLFDLSSSLNIDDSIVLENIDLFKGSLRTYYFEYGLNANSSSNNFVKSFNWNRKYGLIRYTSWSGEVFERRSI